MSRPTAILRTLTLCLVWCAASSLTCSADTLKAEPYTAEELISRSSAVVYGSIVKFTYRILDPKSAQYGEEVPVEPPASRQGALSAHIEVDEVLFQRGTTPTLKKGDVVRYWLRLSDMNRDEYRSDPRIFFLLHAPLQSSALSIEGFSQAGGSRAPMQSRERVLEALAKPGQGEAESANRRFVRTPDGAIDVSSCSRTVCRDYIVDDCSSDPRNPELISADAMIYVQLRRTDRLVAQCGVACDTSRRRGTICPSLCMVDFKGCHGERDGQAAYGWGK